ncbi:MAG: RraA family protein, partial [Firmicutes bacterium]|nr:RraA family protein [Bacillota bacterium]
IECGGVRVCPGDFIFGDNDGIVVIPEAVTNEVLVKALEKVAAENIVREELKKGKSAKEVYEKYGIL